MRLNGHTVFITGGGAGIGLALARGFLAAGSRVIVCGRSLDRLEAARRDTPGLEILRCDVTRDDEVRAAREELAARAAAVSILVNNAAVGHKYTFPLDADAARKTEDEIRTNLLAAVRLAGAFLPDLLQRPEAAIVNVTSGFAICPSAAAIGYSTAKAGLRAFTRALREQLRHTRVRVVEVLPPMVDTELVREARARKMTPEQVADIALRGLARNRAEIAIGDVRLMKLAERLAPALLFRFMARYPIALRDMETHCRKQSK